MGLLDFLKDDEKKEEKNIDLIDDETFDVLYNAEESLIKNDFVNALDLVDDDEDEDEEEEK